MPASPLQATRVPSLCVRILCLCMHLCCMCVCAPAHLKGLTEEGVFVCASPYMCVRGLMMHS